VVADVKKQMQQARNQTQGFINQYYLTIYRHRIVHTSVLDE